MAQPVNEKGMGYAPAPDKDYHYDDLEAGPEAQSLNMGDLAFNGGKDFEAQLRMGFIRKVYGILSVQLLLTFAVCAVCVLVDPVRDFVLGHVWLVYLGFAASIVLLLCLLCYKEQYPLNLQLLVAWTLVEAYTVGVVCASYASVGQLLVAWTLVEAYTVGVVCASYASVGQGTIVVQAAGLTMAVFLGLTLFTFQSKIDFSFMGGALFACLWIFLLWGIVSAIFGFRSSFVYSLLGAVLFSLYILYDTSLLIHKLNYDEYILASINLYLDILNLFLYILRMLAASDRR